MAKRDAMSAALARLDAQIDDLNRAKQALLDAQDAAQAVERKPRKPRQKKGLPASAGDL